MNYQLSCVCFYILGRAALTPYLGSVAWCSMCPVGSSGTASPITQAGYWRYTLQIGWVHPPLVVEPLLLLAGQWEGFIQARQLQGLAVTTDYQPPASVDNQLGSGWWCSDMVCSFPLSAQALGFPEWCRPRLAPTCVLSGATLSEL